MAGSRNSRSANLSLQVGEFLAGHAGVAPLCVGLSGGCDSVVLLHVLHGLVAAGRLRAVHVHHGLSANADDWADFCSAYCQRLGVPLSVVRVTVISHGAGIEAAAREARYSAFFAHLPPGAALLLAQHRGDQAETVLFNLLRGSGLAGVAGIRPVRERAGMRILRPLLGVARGEIEDYARAYGLAWVEDESNRDTSLSRNFLRHAILPALTARFPAAEVTLARAAGHFAEASALLDEMAAQDWALVAVGERAALAGLRGLSISRLKNLLRWRLQMLGWQVPVADRLEEFARQILTAAPDRHPELVLPAGCMRLSRGWLSWLSVQ